MPRDGRLTLRDRALLLFLYNTGARVQEVADLRVGNLDLGEYPSSACTAKATSGGPARSGSRPRSCSESCWTRRTTSHPQDRGVLARGQPLTRFGIYKIVRRHAAGLDDPRTGRHVSPHTFRHTAAVHLLEAGVEVNVIRGWLGHADLTTTNRYAEINTKSETGGTARDRTSRFFGGTPTKPIWRTDETLLNWLASL